MKLFIDSKLLIEAERLRDKIISYRPFPQETVRSLREYYRIGLTYTSNALEGNSLTESETKIVVEEGLTIEGKPLRDVYEAIGHASAYDHLQSLSLNKPLEESDILELHRRFYEKIDSGNAGKYRQVQVFISGSKYPVTRPENITSEMKEFVKWFNDNEGKMSTLEFAAIAHLKFVFIHPFIDGNGRMARLLLNLALLRGEYTIAIIPTILRHEYIQKLELGHKEPKPFIDFIAERVITTQMDLIRMIRGGGNEENGGVNKQNGGVKIISELMNAIETYPGMNAPALANTIQKSLRTTQRYLKVLTDEKKISFRGAAKNGGYYPNFKEE